MPSFLSQCFSQQWPSLHKQSPIAFEVLSYTESYVQVTLMQQKSHSSFGSGCAGGESSTSAPCFWSVCERVGGGQSKISQFKVTVNALQFTNSAMPHSRVSFIIYGVSVEMKPFSAAETSTKCLITKWHPPFEDWDTCSGYRWQETWKYMAAYAWSTPISSCIRAFMADFSFYLCK